MPNCKKILVISLFFVFSTFVLVNFSFAQRELEVPFPPAFEKTPLLPKYIETIFNFALIIIGLIVFGVLIYGGIRYLTSAGSPTAMTDAKSWIFGAFLGLIILFCSYLILTTINPELWTIKEPAIGTLPAKPEPALPLCFDPYELRTRGDVNKDCIIDSNDLNYCSAPTRLGSTPGVGPWDPACDLADDERIGQADFDIISAHLYVKCCGLGGLDSSVLFSLGDLNQDCVINMFDLNILARAVGGTNAEVDINKDGVVDKCDVSIVAGTTFGLKCGDLLDPALLLRLGDLEQDCAIDAQDIYTVARAVGGTNAAADLNKDGVVDICDVSIVSGTTLGLHCSY
jgi:hypothetical protein